MEKKVKEKFLVSRIYGAYYEIYSPDNGKKRAVLRGKFRIENTKDRHPFVVGDRVVAQPSFGDEWVIVELEERRNFLTRKSGFNDTHVLCANIDQIAIFASLKDPQTKEGFIDRALVASNSAEIQPIVVFTKSDLVSEKDSEDIISQYDICGVKTILVSAYDEKSIQNLRESFLGKTTFLVGNSGVGKSTILNKFLEEKIQETAEISQSTKKGRHTTTNSNLVPLSDDTFLIDSPGLKEWGLLHLSEREIIQNFPGLSKHKKDCKASHCCNLGEDCKILEELAKENFPKNRKKSLESILESLTIEKSSQEKQDSYRKDRKKGKSSK